MKTLNWIALILVLVGGLNWGLVGLAGTDLVATLGETLAGLVYILVGLSALYLVFKAKRLASAL